MRKATFDLHGVGDRDHEVYVMPPVSAFATYWDAVTNVPCPVKGCDQTLAWYEAWYVPGYRVCMALLGGEFDNEYYDANTIRHRFLAGGDKESPTLVRDDCCE